MKQSALTRTIPAAVIFAAALLLLCVSLPQRAAASSVPFRIDFDQSKLDVGVLQDLPLDTIASGASLDGKLYDNGVVIIPKGEFKMPEVGITSPVAIRGFMGIENDASGRYDPATGRLDLDAEAGLWVSVNIQQALGLLGGSVDLGTLGPLLGLLGPELTCGFGPMDVHFTTEGTSLAEGGRFTEGPLGSGSLSAEWSKLGPFSGPTKVLGLDACTTLRALLPGLLNNLGGDLLGGVDLGALLNGVDLDNVDLGPSGITLIRSIDENPDVEPPLPPVATSPKLKLKVTPRARRARAGKAVKYRATIVNSGGGRASGVSVCIRAPKKAVRAKRCQEFGTIAAGTAKGRTFRLRIKRNAAGRKYRIRFRTRATAGPGPKSSARLRIR